MRILVNFRKPFVALEEALAEQGCELVRNCWAPEEAIALKADACLVDFCDGARHLWQLWRLSRALHNSSVTLIGIDRDAPWYKGVHRRRLWAMARLRPLDIYASHSLQGAERFGRPLYLPNAAWVRMYHLHGRTLKSLRDPASYTHDVSFLGNIDAKRYPEHQPRLEFLLQLQTDLAQTGIKLTLFDSTRMSGAEQVEVIQHSRINLNYGAAADNAGQRSWGLPERCYGIPACGGFFLSDHRQHAAQDFEPGAEWAEFESPGDCVNKVRYYLTNFAELRSVAEAAHNRVMRDHTYQQRAGKLVEAIKIARYATENKQKSA